MTLSPEQRDILIKLLRELTPGHVSTLIVALDEPDSQIGTSTDSANYAFLRQLCEWGFAIEVPLELDLPPEMSAGLTSFSLKEDAKVEIAQFLETVTRNDEGKA